MRKLTLYRDDSTTQVVFDNVKHFFFTAGNTVLTIAQYTNVETGKHRYIHWPRERFCWFKDEPPAQPGAPGTREALKDHADWLEQQIALWKRVMSKEAELHNTHAWERASARVTAYKDCLEMLRAAALAQPGAPTKEG